MNYDQLEDLNYLNHQLIESLNITSLFRSLRSSKISAKPKDTLHRIMAGSLTITPEKKKKKRLSKYSNLR